MIWVVSLVIGVLIGWLFSLAASRRNKNIALNIVLSAGGAVLFYWLFAIVLAISASTSAGTFWLGMLWSAIGAGVVLAITEGIESSYYSDEYMENTPDSAMMGRTYPHEYEDKKEQEDEMKEKHMK